MPKRKPPRKPLWVNFSIRRLRDDLRDRLRVEATLRRTNIERVTNEAIEHGLKVLKRERLKVMEYETTFPSGIDE